MATLAVKNLDAPDEVRGRTRLVTLNSAKVARAVFERGWRWSVHSKPVIGGDSCRTAHLGYVISGRLGILMDDGTEGQIEPGNAFEIPPGHDAWVIGDEPCTIVEFFPLAAPHNQASQA